jgi:hypothetical protein
MASYNAQFAKVGSKFVMISPSNFNEPHSLLVPIESILDVYADKNMVDTTQIKLKMFIRTDEAYDDGTGAVEDEEEVDYVDDILVAEVKVPFSHVAAVLSQF